jgi:signal transduction histidine kinase
LADEEVQRSRQGLRNLAIQLQTARDDERLSVAREVHDELGQSLIALKLRLGALRARLSAEHHPLREQTAAMMALVDVG